MRTRRQHQRPKIKAPKFKFAFKPKRITNNQVRPWTPVIVALGIIFFLFISPLFKISSIECKFGNDACPEEFIAELNNYRHKSSFTLPKVVIEDKFKNTFPDIKDAKINVTLPATLEAEFTVLNRQNAIKVHENSAALIVSPDHKVINQVVESSGPYLLFHDAVNLRIGEYIESEPLIFALDLATRLTEQNIPFTYIDANSPLSIEIIMPNDRKIITTSHNGIERQVTTLQLILAKDTMTPDLPVLDVRFDKAILKPFKTASPSGEFNTL